MKLYFNVRKVVLEQYELEVPDDIIDDDEAVQQYFYNAVPEKPIDWNSQSFVIEEVSHQ